MRPNYKIANILVGTCALVLAGSAASAATPVIHAQWDEGGSQQPLEGTHYIIRTAAPASPDFPDVELIAGRLDWRIWSTDTDNPNGIGDIGVISSPHAQNFALTIRNDADPFQPGARTVKAIRLVPSSTNNYSNIAQANISGELTDELIVQPDSSGTGGHVEELNIAGVVSGDMTIHRVTYLGVSNEVSGTIVIDELALGLDIGHLSGDVSIGTATGHVRIFLPISGSLTVSETTGGFFTFFPSGVAASGVLTFGDLSGAQHLQFGSSPGGGSGLAGTLRLLGGIPEFLTVDVATELTSTGVIDLNGMGLAGSLRLHGGGSGSIINGGAVSGYVDLGILEEFPPAQYPFSGTATFAGIAAAGSVATINGADLTGTVRVTGSTSGNVTVTGKLYTAAKLLVNGDLGGLVDVSGDADGEIIANADGIGTGNLTAMVTVGGVFNGNICGSNLSPSQSLPSNIKISTFGPLWRICGAPGCTCNAPSCDPVDCNNNNNLDLCDILGDTSEDCNNNGVPDECGEGSPLAKLTGTSMGYSCDSSLPRLRQHTVRLKFACDVTAPSSAQVEIRELLSAGGFGSTDLSSSFTFSIENGRTLRIRENGTGTVLNNQTWYGIRNTGSWSDVEAFEMDYVALRGDADNTGGTGFSDLVYINNHLTGSAADDDRSDINADTYVDFADISDAYAFNGSLAPTKPSGHPCTVP